MNNEGAVTAMPRGQTPRIPSKSGKQGRVSTPAPTAIKPSPRATPAKAATKKTVVATPAKKAHAQQTPARLEKILKALDKMYPAADCALTHSTAWELLVATILSAQCTDARVNMVTPELFRKFPTVRHIAALSAEELEPEIRSTGFYRNKAKSIVTAARRIVDVYQGEVPSEMDELLTLAGVARKTANVVLGVWYKKAEGVVVDTHVHRIARRLEFTKEDDPQKIEKELMKTLPRERWIAFSHQIIHHGRGPCKAQRPQCFECGLSDLCRAEDRV